MEKEYLYINVSEFQNKVVRISDIKSKSKITDFDIIEILMLNSRKSFVEIASELNVTETAVRKRIRKMETQGIIERYSIDINPKKLGFGMRVLVGLDTEAKAYISTIQKFKKMDENLRIYSSSGDHDIMVEVWMKSDVELDKFIHKLEKINGVTEVCPAIIKEIIK